jgi:hypothetical protein
MTLQVDGYVFTVFSVLYSSLLKAKEDNEVLSKREHEFKRPGSKSVSASWCMKNGASKTKNYSLRSQKNAGTVVQICFDTYSTCVIWQATAVH